MIERTEFYDCGLKLFVKWRNGRQRNIFVKANDCLKKVIWLIVRRKNDETERKRGTTSK